MSSRLKNKADFAYHIALAVKLLRKSVACVKQEHWAKLLGVDRSHYSKMETGKRRIEYRHLEIIAKELQMTPEEITLLAGILMRQGKTFGTYGLSIKLWLVLEGKRQNVQLTADEIERVINTAEEVFFGKKLLP